MNKYRLSIWADMDVPYRPTKLSPIRSNVKLKPLPELDMDKCIKKCMELENTLRGKIVENECPVCYNILGDTDCVIPSCGHKTCISCFISNITHNKHTGINCVLCRKKYT